MEYKLFNFKDKHFFTDDDETLYEELNVFLSEDCCCLVKAYLFEEIGEYTISIQTAKATMSYMPNSNTLADIIASNLNKFIIGVLSKDIHVGEIKKSKKMFPNCFYVLIKSPLDTGKKINMKIFKNGKITMSGCKIKEDGLCTIKILENFIKKFPVLFDNENEIKKFKIEDFQTTNVVANYAINFEIDREKLFEIIREKYDHLYVSYKPTIYSGVKLYVYYNSNKLKQQNGVCECPNKFCSITKKKTSGHNLNQCKKITIAFFQSGKILITGGRDVIQTTAAYNFINNIIIEESNNFKLIKLSELYVGLWDNIHDPFS